MFPASVIEPKPQRPKLEFQIVGKITSPEFQACRCYVERLYKSYPQEYAEPDIRPMLDVEWTRYIKQIKVKIGGERLWALEKPVAVFMDGNFLGHEQDLLAFISRKYRLTIAKNFVEIGTEHLAEHILNQIKLGNRFVYFTISIDDRIIGSLLFQIYADVVPIISDIFIKRCLRKYGGYAGTPIQRIALPSWIQCGGWKLTHHKIPCENYIVPHDRRGILSMCHNGKHTDNSTQFFITLDPTPWMDYKYVAFGRLIQGEDVLQIIESVPTRYEAPLKKIDIVKCGELDFYPAPDPKRVDEVNRFLLSRDLFKPAREELLDPRDVDSLLHRRRYKKNLYAAATDLQSYKPFLHLPDYLIYKQYLEEAAQASDGEEECSPAVERIPQITFKMVGKSQHLTKDIFQVRSVSNIF